MDLSRRRLFGAVGAAGLAGLAGCAAPAGIPDPDAVADELDPRGASGGGSPPDGSLAGALRDATYAPGHLTDARHQLLSVRDFDAMRDDSDGNHVAAALLDRPLAKAERGFDLDPATVSSYATYGPTEVFAGSFDRETLVASYREDGWKSVGTHHGVELFAHPEYGDHYGGGVGDGVLFTSARRREVPGTEYVRGHAAAAAGEADRYAADPRMGALLDVVGGGDHVTAITCPADLGERPPNTRAVGRAMVVEGSDLVTTFAFYFDEDAPTSPGAYADEWADRYASQGSGPNRSLEPTSGASGRVGYFTVRLPASDFDEEDTVTALEDRDPTASMAENVGERYTERNGIDPPDVAFVYRPLPDADDADCGPGDHVVELTHDGGPAVLARRLGVAPQVDGQVGPPLPLRRCGFDVDDTLESGDAVRADLQVPADGVLVYWNGPHGTVARLDVERAEDG